MLVLAWKGAGQPDNHAEWITAQRASLGAAATTTTTTTTEPVIKPTATSNMGAPVVKDTDPTKPEGDPKRWPPAFVANMSNEAWRQACADYDRAQGGHSKVMDEFAKMRARSEASRKK